LPIAQKMYRIKVKVHPGIIMCTTLGTRFVREARFYNNSFYFIIRKFDIFMGVTDA